ncbi:MAG: GAF domain-containing protein [Chlorobiota bacterium]
MVEEVKRLLRLLTPIDWLAAGVILLGLLIALALDDAAVRLIGVSVALLGAVAFFVLLSQRFGDGLPPASTLRSQAARLRKTVQQESRGTRLIFDDFAEAFTTTEGPEGSADADTESLEAVEFADSISSVRIVGRRPRQEAATLSVPAQQQPTPPPPAPPARIRAVSLPEFVIAPAAAPAEPRHAFRALIERVLTLVRLITPTRTAALFWLDAERQALFLEAWQSDIPELFRADPRRTPLGHDIVSQIASEGRAEIVTEIQPTAELELLPYYREPAKTSSFVGVPILLQNRPVGVLCLDSDQPHAYTATTVSLLGHIVLLIGGLLQNYIQHYELRQKAKVWESVTSLWDLRSAPNGTFEQGLLELFVQLVPAPVALLCLYSPTHRGWRVAALRAPEAWSSLQDVLCLLEGTLIGAAIYSGEPQRWNESTHRFRLHPNEPPLATPSYAYAFPLCSETHAYGALYCELAEPLAPQEEELLETVGRWVGGILEHRYWQEQLRGGLWFSVHQGLWTEPGFRHRIAEEIERIACLQSTAVLCALQVDRYGSLAGLSLAQMRTLLSGHVVPLLRSQARPCDLIGYLAEDMLGLLLPGMELTHAQLWAEGVRKQVATTVFSFEGHRLSLTLSIGLTDLRRHKSAEDALRAVQIALQKALQKGNSVIPYD